MRGNQPAAAIVVVVVVLVVGVVVVIVFVVVIVDIFEFGSACARSLRRAAPSFIGGRVSHPARSWRHRSGRWM